MTGNDKNNSSSSQSFYKGQKVVCIDDLFDPERLLTMIDFNMKAPVKGKVYTIREVVPCWEDDGILLNEIVNACQQFRFEYCEPIFFSFRFCPLSDMEEMLEAEKEMEEALVG